MDLSSRGEKIFVFTTVLEVKVQIFVPPCNILYISLSLSLSEIAPLKSNFLKFLVRLHGEYQSKYNFVETQRKFIIVSLYINYMKYNRIATNDRDPS